ncbi:MAG: RNA polymerase sigma factor [Myxococcota bacterium]
MVGRRKHPRADVYTNVADSELGSDDLDEAASRFVAGDASAFQFIVENTIDALVRLGARMMGSVSDGEDVVQEAYLKAYRGLAEGRFDQRARLRTWLGRIVVNTAIDALRARKRAPLASRDLLESPDASASAETRVALAELDAWLDGLPPDQRAAIVLKSIEGYTSAEVAEILECSEGAVEQRLVRARANLRNKGSLS